MSDLRALPMCAALVICAYLATAQASTVTFDEPGYVAGTNAPSPWSEEYANPADWGVAAGIGYNGTQALTVDYPRRVVYDLPTPLNSTMGAQRISILFDPAGPTSTANYCTYGGLQVGNGSQKYGTGRSLGVIFRKQGSNVYAIYGPGGYPGEYMGSFTPTASANWYEIVFEMNDAWDTMTLSAGPAGGAMASMQYGWDGTDINRVWPAWGDSDFTGLPGVYDNLYVSEPTAPGDTDLDGDVDLTDFNTLKANFESGPGRTWAEGDFTGDGEVKLDDFVLLKDNFTGAAPVPEPATLSLLALGGLALLRSRR